MGLICESYYFTNTNENANLPMRILSGVIRLIYVKTLSVGPAFDSFGQHGENIGNVHLPRVTLVTFGEFNARTVTLYGGVPPSIVMPQG